MAFSDYLIIGALLAILKKNDNDNKQRKAEEKEAFLRYREELDRKIELERKRKLIKCSFDNGISKDEFLAIAVRCSFKFKRVEITSVDNATIYCTVTSNSKLSTWGFSIDFNDYGFLSGEFKLDTDNDDSIIPENLANCIANEIVKKNLSNGFNPKDMIERNKKLPIERFEYDNSERSYSKEVKKEEIIFSLKKIIIFVIVMFVVCISLFFACWASTLKQVKFDNYLYIGHSAKDVISKLKENGFKNVKSNVINDLNIYETERIGKITKIDYKNVDFYKKIKKYPSIYPITITYHDLKYISSPLSPKESKGMDYRDVENRFRIAGFSDISYNVEYDIVTGWLSSDGEVESVTINDINDYSSEDQFKVNSRIVITYHTYKKNKK